MLLDDWMRMSKSYAPALFVCTDSLKKTRAKKAVNKAVKKAVKKAARRQK
jgi:hypothetical protein